MSHLEVAYQLTSSPLVLAAQWLLLLLVPLLFLRHYYYASRRSMSSRRRLRHGNDDDNQTTHHFPPSPPGLPIIGHLHLIGNLPHVSLRDLSAKHGGRDGLMLLRLGAVPTLIVSSLQATEAIMRTHDHVFASRPASTVSDELMYGSSDVAFCPYGEHWRKAKKLVTVHLLTTKKVQSYRSARREEVRLVLAKVQAVAVAGTAAVDVIMMMNMFANDVVSRTVLGKFVMAEGRIELFRELVEANSALFGGFNLEYYFPRLARSLGFLSRRSLRNRAHETHKRWDELLETILPDHERRNSNSMMHHRHDHEGEGDFTDVLLSVQKEYGMTRDHVKAILVDMFVGGTNTSSLVLVLAMAELMRNPQKMAKLQGEVREHTPGGQETVEEENLSNMPYLKAVLKETLRLHPPAPLLVPRLSMADCIVVDGYYVPSGTRVIVNAWALGRDPESWKEKPEEFMPERFMDGGSAAGIDFRGNHFQFLPFGAGRRICAGINFGMATIEIMLANLMYCFDWQLPVGMEEKGVDMTEVFGVTMRLKEKLMLVPVVPKLRATSGHSMQAAEDKSMAPLK